MQARYAIKMSNDNDDRDRLIEAYERRLNACSAKVDERVNDLEDTTESDVWRAAVADIALLTHAIAVLRIELAQIQEMVAMRLAVLAADHTSEHACKHCDNQHEEPRVQPPFGVPVAPPRVIALVLDHRPVATSR